MLSNCSGRSRGCRNGLLLWLEPETRSVTSKSKSSEERSVVLRVLLWLLLEIVGRISQIYTSLNDVSDRVEQVWEQLSPPASLGVVELSSDVDIVGHAIWVFLGLGC